MLIRRAEERVFIRTPAKVNLFLEVLARRPDGYHDLATLMIAVSLYDTLEIRRVAGSEIRLECDQPGLSVGPDNLVHRAAVLVRERFGRQQGLDIRLCKRIPMGAGLAGGSSDAAAILAGLDRLFELGLSQAELAALGGELGSDVPFFSPPRRRGARGGERSSNRRRWDGRSIWSWSVRPWDWRQPRCFVRCKCPRRRGLGTWSGELWLPGMSRSWASSYSIGCSPRLKVSVPRWRAATNVWPSCGRRDR